MPIWNKYKKIKELNSCLNIKTYLAKYEPIIKEIIPRNKDNYYEIIQKLEKLKCKYKIFDIIEENEKIYLVLDNDNEILSNFDKLIIGDIKLESIIEGHSSPISKNEILKLFEMEKSICKIRYERIENGKLIKGKGTGFFCELDNLPIKYDYLQVIMF